MRIRTRLTLSALIAAIVAIAVVVALVQVTRQAQRGLDEQAESQEVVRHVANMLALTNEMVAYGGDRVAAQWRSRHAQLMDAIHSALRRGDPPEPSLLELERNLGDLPPLFEKLVEIGREAPSDLGQRRRELLLERLLAETQEVVESRHRWATVLGQAQQRNQRLYTAIVLAAPAALLLLLSSLFMLVVRRVLKPARRLEAAAVAFQNGCLDVRCASDANDELGDAARAVDAMARALQQQSAALHASEQRLQLITDNVPALISYIDTEERYRFANAHFGRSGSGDPAQMLGRSVLEVSGEAMYRVLAPHIARALAGQTSRFESTWPIQGRAVHRQSTYVPDLDDAGGVRGFYGVTFDVTERKEAELLLAASERMLVNLTDNLPALVAYIDRNGHFRFANSKYLEWRGIEPASMIGRPVREVFGDVNADEMEPHVATALAGQRIRFERHMQQDGREMSFLVDFIPDIHHDGSVIGFYAQTIDISERRAAELAIARSEQRLMDLINNIPAMVGYFDADERCEYANDTALRRLGRARSQLAGVTLREGLGEANYAQYEPHVRQALAGRRSRLQVSMPRPRGDSHVQAHLIPDQTEAGATRGFYLMSFDVTPLIEAQRRQARVERQLRAITDNLPVMITHLDTEQRYRFVNATVHEWLGVEPGSLIGRTFRETVGEANYAQRRAHLEAALAGERVEFGVESTALGRTRNLQSVYIPDIQSDGQVAGIYTLTTDITALKQVEHQLGLLARVDSLTHLANRRQFEERLDEAIARSARDGRPLGLMFLDIDHFKSINDTWGHATGDAVLKEFATRLKHAVRATDLPARLAGDEFVVLLEGLNSEADAARVAEKLVAAVRKPFVVAEAELQVTTSVGIAFAAKPTLHGDLMESADRALYRAKSAGRDTFEISTIGAFASPRGALIAH